MMAAVAQRATAASTGAEHGQDGGRDWFNLRVGYQQFMRENEPLFRALAASADNPFTLLEGGGFAEAAQAAKAISVTAARRLTGKQDPAAKEIRPFRTAAATMVAAAWQAGGLRTLDPEVIGDQLAASASVVDEELDRSLYKDSSISDETSLKMTAMSVTLRLMEPVMTYDFRRDRSEMIVAMASTVMTTAAEASRDVVADDAKPEDRRTVVQTLASCLAAVMAQVYERKAKQYVAHVVSMPEAERESFARRYDPMPDVLRGFRENAKVYAGAAFASARAATEAVAGPVANKESTPH